MLYLSMYKWCCYQDMLKVFNLKEKRFSKLLFVDVQVVLLLAYDRKVNSRGRVDL